MSDKTGQRGALNGNLPRTSGRRHHWWRWILAIVVVLVVAGVFVSVQSDMVTGKFVIAHAEVSSAALRVDLSMVTVGGDRFYPHHLLGLEHQSPVCGTTTWHRGVLARDAPVTTLASQTQLMVFNLGIDRPVIVEGESCRS